MSDLSMATTTIKDGFVQPRPEPTPQPQPPQPQGEEEQPK